MLINLIKKVRRQPKPVRDKVAMTIAGTFTGLVFVIWVFNFPARNLAVLNQNNNEESIFSDALDQISGQYASIKESMNAANATSTLEATSDEENSATSSIEDNFLIIDKDNKVWSAVSSSSNHQVNSDETELNAATTSTSTTTKSEPVRAVRIVPVSNSAATTSTTTANN